jgi:beta-galactosidase
MDADLDVTIALWDKSNAIFTNKPLNKKIMKANPWRCTWQALILSFAVLFSCSGSAEPQARKRIPINDGWYFFKYASGDEADALIYDVRPEESDYRDDVDADSRPTAAVEVDAEVQVLKAWVLPTANAFISDPEAQHVRPEGDPGSGFPFVRADFDDSSWKAVKLPHDWGIEGPFLEGWNAEVGGGMGRLPGHGVAWYRRKLEFPASCEGKSVFLDVDGAMSYAMVWLNGHLVGGWPYGYNSWRVDLTPYVVPGGINQLAVRVDTRPDLPAGIPGEGSTGTFGCL